MFLDDLQKRFADMQGKGSWKAVFGDVIEVDGHRLIPVASVQYGFGMGGGMGSPARVDPKGRAAAKASDPAPGGGGGGGGMRVEPVALIDLSNGRVHVAPIVNVTRLAIVALAVAAWSIFWMARAAHGRTAAPRP